MSDILTVENIGNLIIFLAPGYLARLIYRSVFAKKELTDTPILITSAVYSLPIVVLSNQITRVLNEHVSWFISNAILHVSTDWRYVVLLFVVSLSVGYGCVLLRRSSLARRLLGSMGFSSPEQTIYEKVMTVDHYYSYCTVTLKNGSSFGGVLTQSQVDGDTAAKALYFSGIRWQDENGNWNPTTGSAILIPAENIELIEFSASNVSSSNSATFSWIKRIDFFIERLMKKIGGWIKSIVQKIFA